MTPGDYYFYVHDYTNRNSSDSAAMSESGVNVKIFRNSTETLCTLDDGSKAEFRIPSRRTATVWKVCKIHIDESGTPTITKYDFYSFESDPSMVGE